MKIEQARSGLEEYNATIIVLIYAKSESIGDPNNTDAVIAVRYLTDRAALLHDMAMDAMLD